MSMRNFINLTENFEQPQQYIAQGVASYDGTKFDIQILPNGPFRYLGGTNTFYGELNAHFTSPVTSDTHMYGDKSFIKQIQNILKKAGFKHWKDIMWSEAGMQDLRYANFDVGFELASELNDKGFIEIVQGKKEKWTEGVVQPKKYIAQGTADVAGNGLWSEKSMTNLKIHILPQTEFWQDKSDSAPVGQLNVYFNPRIWNTDKLGLIYTDSLFLTHVRRLLKAERFFHFQDLDYSEQGMQGDDYVNFDVGDNLAKELDKKGFITVVPYEEWRG